jgi:hypothetical protein
MLPPRRSFLFSFILLSLTMDLEPETFFKFLSAFSGTGRQGRNKPRTPARRMAQKLESSLAGIPLTWKTLYGPPDYLVHQYKTILSHLDIFEKKEKEANDAAPSRAVREGHAFVAWFESLQSGKVPLAHALAPLGAMDSGLQAFGRVLLRMLWMERVHPDGIEDAYALYSQTLFTEKNWAEFDTLTDNAKRTVAIHTALDEMLETLKTLCSLKNTSSEPTLVLAAKFEAMKIKHDKLVMQHQQAVFVPAALAWAWQRVLAAKNATTVAELETVLRSAPYSQMCNKCVVDRSKSNRHLLKAVRAFILARFDELNAEVQA